MLVFGCTEKSTDEVVAEKLLQNAENKLRIFVAKEGLYMSVNHPENYDNEEDFMSFVLYELADAKK